MKAKPKVRTKPKVPEAFDVHVTPEGVELIALSGKNNRLHYTAYRIASELKSGDTGELPTLFGSVEHEHMPKLLKLVVDAYNDSARFEPTPYRRRIISAYFAASPWRNGAFVVPTLDAVKEKFCELFPKAEMPKNNETFKRAFRELPQLRDWRKGKGGYPRGRKHQILLPQDKRKRRKKTHSRKRALGVVGFSEHRL